uniref:GPI-GlcNAc transferase complex PIG-H component conserved domain-containing protein n=1 Tax=Plectus sambesii TaxID=2011161 RepID=A0A914V3P7_9BILA
MLMTSIVEVILFPPPLEFKDSTVLNSNYLRTALVAVLIGLVYGRVGRFGISWRQPEEVYLALLRWLRHLFYWPELIYCVAQPQYSLTVLPYLVLLWIFQDCWVHYWYTKAENTNAQNTNAQNTNAQNTNAQNTNAQNTNALNPNAQNTNAQNPNAQNTNAQKQDQFLKLVTFSLYFLTSGIYWKRNVMDLGLVSAGILFLSLGAIWLTQLVIFIYFKSQAVLVASGQSSADSGHLLVKAGGEILEIFKVEGVPTDKIVTGERVNMPQFHIWQYFCVPTLTYGIMGRSSLNVVELHELFVQVRARLQGEDYNSSYHSCQEIALNYAAEITKPEDYIAISLTMSKSLLLAVSAYLPGLLLVAWSRLNVSVQWRHD